MATRISIVKDSEEFFLKTIPGQNIILDDYLSAFDTGVAIKSGYNVGLNFPVEGNERAFDFSHVLQVRNGFHYYMARIYGVGITLEVTMLLERTAYTEQGDTYDTNIIGINFNSLIEKKTLYDACDSPMEMGGNWDEFFSYVEAANHSNWPEFQCAFPMIKNPKLRLSDTGELLVDTDYVGWMNVWDIEANSPLTDHTNDAVSTNPYCPQVYFAEVLKHCFSFVGYTATGDVFNDPFFCKQVMLGLKMASGRKYNHGGMVEVSNAQVIGPNKGLINWEKLVFNNGGGVLPEVSTGTLPLDTHSSSSEIGVYINLKIGKITGLLRLYDSDDNLIVETDHAGNGIFYYVTTLHATTAPWGIKVGCEETGEIEILPGSQMFFYMGTSGTMSFDWNLREFVPPKIEVADFIKKMKVWWSLDFEIDDISRSVVIRMSRDILKIKKEYTPRVYGMVEKKDLPKKRYTFSYGQETKAPVTNARIKEFDNRPDIDSITDGFIFVRSENAWIEKLISDDGLTSEWKFFGYRNVPARVGDSDFVSEENVDFGVELAPMSQVDYFIYKVLVPSIELEGRFMSVFDWPTYVGIEWPLMAMTYHGMWIGAGVEYPWASSTNIDMLGNMVGESRLALDYRDDGFFKRYHYDWARALTNPVMITLRELSNYMMAKRNLKYSRLRVGENLFLASKISGSVTDDEGVITVEAYAVNFTHKETAPPAGIKMTVVYNTIVAAEIAAKFGVNGVALAVDFGDGTPLADIDCSALSGGIVHYYTGGGGLQTVKFTPDTGVNQFDVTGISIPMDGDGVQVVSLTNIPVQMNILYLQYQLLDEFAVNSILVELDNNGAPYGEVYIDGQNGGPVPPTGTGAAAKTSLLAKGWVVVTD